MAARADGKGNGDTLAKGNKSGDTLAKADGNGNGDTLAKGNNLACRGVDIILAAQRGQMPLNVAAGRLRDAHGHYMRHTRIDDSRLLPTILDDKSVDDKSVKLRRITASIHSRTLVFIY